MVAIEAAYLTKKYNDTLAVDRLNLQIHKYIWDPQARGV